MSDRHQSRPATTPTALDRHELEVRMLAVRDHVPGLRALLAEQAMRADFDLDFIDDVRLAVDEVCALALVNCTPRDVLTVRLLVDATHVRIEASVPTTLDEPRVNGLSLRVLQALADSLDHGIDENGTERVFHLGFGRSRRPHPSSGAQSDGF
ncbi:MAG TPA: hypothetical protein VGJ45_31845 [Pseudonocardiaceae bacterium]